MFHRRSRLLWACAMVGALLGAVPASGAPELPPGFELTTFFRGFTGIETLSWAPDGSLWLGQSGPGEGMHLWVWRDGEVTRIHSFPWTPSGERGIHTVKVDPDYLQNGRVWVYYTAYEPVIHNRLSHFTNPAITEHDKHGHADDLVDEAIVFEGPELVDFIHNGGCFAFASDKTLFLGLGDDNRGSSTAQNLQDVRGKILHLNRDGSPAADNPFLGAPGVDPRIWALGFRNPFRCSVQPGLDNLFIGDVGNFTWEEINIGIPGGNFGWAAVEGFDPPSSPGFVYPIYAYPHNGAGAAVVDGDHAEAGDFAAEYQGDYFFAEWVANDIYRMVLDESNNPESVELFASDVGFVTDMVFGPDGALYLAARSTSQVTVRRIAYIGGENRQPSAVATAVPASGRAPLRVVLDGAGSSDPDDDALSFHWTLGDGTEQAGPSVIKSYPPGVYEARLSVDDGKGLSDVTPPIRIVSGNMPPTATISAPPAGMTYDAGQVFAYAGQAQDLHDGALPCSRMSWQVVFHHNDHTHPFLGPEQGNCGGSFTIPDRGETSANVWYVVHLVAEDFGTPLGPEGRLSSAKSVTLYPNTATLTLESAPLPDLELTLDTAPFVPPLSVESVTGLLRDIGAPERQLGSNGLWYRWLSWSDGGAAEHALVTPATDTTLTAFFACVPQELKDLHVEPDGAELLLTWGDGSPHCFADGSARYRVYAGSAARPSAGSGAFPDDPAFRLVGTSAVPSLRFVPEPDDTFFIVVGVNAQGQEGQSGHYGF